MLQCCPYIDTLCSVPDQMREGFTILILRPFQEKKKKMFQKTEQEIWKEIQIHAFESLENLENQKDST